MPVAMMRMSSQTWGVEKQSVCEDSSFAEESPVEGACDLVGLR